MPHSPKSKTKRVKPAERRQRHRKLVDYISVSEVTSLSNYKILADFAVITDASTQGFVLTISRQNLAVAELKDNLNLDALLGQQIVMFLPQMNLDLDGVVVRAKHRGQGIFEVGVEFSPEIPEYWRECLIDLLPSPGEIQDTTNPS